jgi:hypothetical protein
MAAIKPHLERQNDPSETAAERRGGDTRTYEEKVRDGFGGLDAARKPKKPKPELSPQELMQASHAELVRLAYTRKAAFAELAERSISVRAKSYRDGAGEIFLDLDAPITGAMWNTAGAGNMRKFRMLSWTQKMGTPSFSLPAGAPQVGGTCPGAAGGQSIVPLTQLRTAQKLVESVTHKPVILADAICERCYATGGNYAYGSMVLAQAVREMWARAALKDGTFVDTMSWAVANADYMLQGGTVGSGKDKVAYDIERYPGRYFRIHDSGDFFSRSYLEAWKAVANNFKGRDNRITFWAPTRVWAADWGIKAVKDFNSDTNTNLIIRPSTYHINENVPDNLGPGFAQWSVCWSKKVKDRLLTFPGRSKTAHAGTAVPSTAFGWDCQAYAVDDEAHSCRNARGPTNTSGGATKDLGCRACWVKPNTSINYTEH